jgi:hypothetical protein
MYSFRDSSIAQPANAPPRQYLNVSYAEKDEAKSLGARWDSSKRSWYAPNGEPELLKKWGKVNAPPITELQDEDRDCGPHALCIYFAPKSCWCRNIRYAIDPNDRERVETFVFTRAKHRCELCKKCTSDHSSLELQARWEYDTSDNSHVQRLARLMAICSECHDVTHFGKSSMNGKKDQALHHLKTVNRMNDTEVKEHVDASFQKRRDMDSHTWQIDLSLLTKNGIKLAKQSVNSYVNKSVKAKGSTIGDVRKRVIQQASQASNEGSDQMLRGFAFRK